MTFEELMQRVFAGARFVHNHIEAAYVLAFSLVTGPNPEGFIEIIGPSGSGKTTLRWLLKDSLVEPRENWETGHVPILALRASNTRDGFFDSKHFYTRLLHLLGNPFLGCNGPFNEALESADEELERAVAEAARASKFSKPPNETWIRDECELIAKAIGLKYLIVDEAHMMGLVERTRDGISHLESLRAFAEVVGCKLIVLGTYHLLDAWIGSAEINRRFAQVHLRRYSDLVPAELHEYARIAVKLGKDHVFDSGDFVRANIREIYGMALGNPGETKDLFFRARGHAKAAKRDAISLDDLLAGSLSQVKLTTMYEETLVGEQSIIAPDRQFLAVLEAMRHGKLEAELKKARGKKPGKRRPGRRNPKRDPVGFTP